MQSLEVLNTAYLDLLLLHYPRCWDSLCGGSRPEGPWHDSWRALEHAIDDGRLRAIGAAAPLVLLDPVIYVYTYYTWMCLYICV